MAADTEALPVTRNGSENGGIRTNGPRPKRKKWRPVKDQSQFEASLDPGFLDEVATMPGGERMYECIQCGTCSAVCPLSAYMDYTPRRLIAMTRAGCRDDVLHSFSPWMCTSCYACTVECPKQIPITEIMHAIRRIALREVTYPKRFITPVMTREFVSMIEERGRSTESWISTKLYLKTAPMQLLKNLPVGLRLVRRGRLGLGRESIRDRAKLRRMLRAARTPPSRVTYPDLETSRVAQPVVAPSAMEGVS